MTRIRTWALETGPRLNRGGRWTRTLLPSPSIRKLVVIGLAALLVATTLVPILNFIQPNEAQAAWYNEDWKFRKGISVDHDSDEANVYTSISMDTSDTSRFKADCSDLRFTDYNGTTIPYHIVSGCGTSTTDIQLLFGSLPEGEQTLYMYYGNSSASDMRVQESFNNEATGVTTTLGQEESSVGPIAEWKFDEGYGTTAHASSWSGAIGVGDGTINGAAWQSEEMCPMGKCLQFDGVDDFVEVASTPTLTPNNLTVSAWIKPSSVTGDMAIITKSGGSLKDYSLRIQAGKLGFAIFNGGTGYIAETATPLLPNTWQFAVGSWDGTTISLYINGKLGATLQPGVAKSATTEPLFIGARPNFITPAFLKGFIDGPKVYNYARTQQQVQQDYIAGMQSLAQQQANLSNGLVGYWKMDENSWDGTSGEVKDSSGNGNNGQTVGGTTIGSGKFGNGGNFDGVDDYISLGTPTTSRSRTYAIWVNSNIYPESIRRGVIGENGNTRIDYGNGINTSYHALVTLSSGSPGYLELTTDSTTTLGSWNYLVLAVDDDRSEASFYLNGTLSTTATWDPAVRHANSGMAAYIGRVNGSAQFDGGMDEARIYNRALSSTEVQQLYTYAPKPVAYYDFEEGAGSSVYDKSGNGNNGAWSGSGSARYAAGQVGKAGSFNGSDTSVLVDSSADFAVGESLTLSAWVRPGDTLDSDAQVISKGNAWGLALPSGSALKFYFWGANQQVAYTFTPHMWYYITGTFDGTFRRFYVNGTLIGTQPSAAPPTSIDDLYIGRHALAANNYFNGSIDEVKFYNYARTPGQIVQDMQAGRPVVDSPVGYWKFDEGQGTVAHNSGVVGSVLDGAITAAAWDEGRTGTALAFAKTTTKVNAGDPTIARIAGDLTISAWVKPNAVADHNNGILARYSNTTGNKGYNFGLNAIGQLAFRASSDGITAAETHSTNSVPLQSWSYVAVVYSAVNGTASYYINGALDRVAPNQPRSLYIPSGRNLEIGAWDSGSTGPNLFDGLIDEPKLYNSALSAQDIMVDYNHSAGQLVGSASTEPILSGTGQTATKPSNSAGSKYCVPGDTSHCAKPVGEWDFESKNASVAEDSSGNNNNGQILSASYAPGKYGSGLEFDGDADTKGVRVANPGDGRFDFTANDSFTISLWAKTTKTSGWNTPIGKRGDGGSFLPGFEILSLNSTKEFWLGDTTGNTVNVASGSALGVSDGDWHHIEWVIDRNRQISNIYMDTQKVTNDVNISDIGDLTNALPLSIGSRYGGRKFLGSVDEVKLYNYARTPAQVAWDYNYGKPIAQYKFDECSGSVAHNSSSWSGAIGSGDGTINLGSSGVTTVGNCENASSAWGMAKSGKYNSAMSFDGVDDVVTIQNSGSVLNLTRNFSLSVWMKPTTLISTRSVMGKRTTNSASPYVIQTTNHFAKFQSYGQDMAWHTYATDNNAKCLLVENKWQLFTVSFSLDDDIVNLYMNGVACGSTTNVIAPVTSNSENVSIGRDYAYPGIEGQIDDVQIFNYALTDTQVKTLYNGGAVRWGDK